MPTINIPLSHQITLALQNNNIVDLVKSLCPILQTLNNKEITRPLYNTVLTFVANDPITCYEIGLVLGHDAEDAKLFFAQVVKFEAHDARTCFNKGMSFHALGLYEEAIAYYDQAISFTPDAPDSYIHKGKALAALGHHEEALKLYDQAIYEIGIIDAEAYLCKVDSLSALGRTEESEEVSDIAYEHMYTEQYDYGAPELIGDS